VLVSAPMVEDRVTKGYGGMVPAASRDGRCPFECDPPREAAFTPETLSHSHRWSALDVSNFVESP
jgi:hypothetical protein